MKPAIEVIERWRSERVWLDMLVLFLADSTSPTLVLEVHPS